MAEGEGFEPPGRLRDQRFSRPPHSTTLPPLRVGFSSTAPSTSSHVSTALDSPAALLSPTVITRPQPYHHHPATVRRLVLHRVGECLYRSDTGIYYAVLKRKGKQVRKSLETNDKAIARKKLVEYRRQMCRQSPAAGMTFDGLAEQYLEFLKIRGMKPASYQRRVVAVRSLGSYFGGKPVRNITRLNIERWAASRTQDVSARSYNIELETLKQIFTYGLEHEYLLVSPAAALKRRRQVKAAIVIPTKKQFKLLVDDLRLGRQMQNTQPLLCVY